MPVVSRSCPSCDSSIAEDAAFCHRCGTAAEAAVDVGAARARVQRALGAGYQLRHLLGRGGFAEVYAAWDVRLRREVAVKTIRPDVVLSAALIERFRREIDAVAGLRHPHLVPIYDVGERGDVVYFTMPRIVGETLAEVLGRESRLEVAEAARILGEAGGALAAAHRAGVIHRDVKPENIMLEGLDRRVAITDFGIAKSMAGHADGLTGDGLAIGTPQYMSPEQTLGERDVDERADQYSLAMVGYQMLAGRLPFGDASPRAVMFRQVTEVPTPLSEVRPDVPEALSSVIARALAKDPALRYPSMQEFVAAVADATRAGVATPRAGTRLPATVERVAIGRALLGRWRWAAGLAAVGAALLVAASAIAPPPSGVPVAARRDEALYAGRAFLRSVGQPAAAMDRMALVVADSVHDFLHAAVGRAEADRRGAGEGAVWRWRVHGFDRARRVARHVELTPDGRVVSFAEIAADSAPVRLPADSARALAERALAERGWRPDALRLVRESATHGRATAYSFEWAPAAGAARAAADTSARRVRVEVAGDRVSRYDERYDTPRVASAGAADVVPSLLRAAGWGVVIVALMYACVVAARRARDDVVEWGLGLRAAAVCAVLSLAVPGVELAWEGLVPADFRGDAWSGVIGLAVAGPVAIALLTAMVAGAESLARAHRVRLVLGLHEVAAGRLDAPELRGTALLGYGAGALVAGLAALVRAAGGALLGRPDATGVPTVLEYGSATLVFGGELGFAIAGALLLLFACAFGAARRLPTWLAVAWPVAVYALLAAPHRVADAPGWLAGLVTVGAATAVVWRLGAIAGVLVLLVCLALPDVVTLLRDGAPETGARALASAAWLLAPLAAVLWRGRRAARPARVATPAAAAALK